MGLITQAVAAVVGAVEAGTGNQGSSAGDWTEQQAAKVEDAAAGAAAAVDDAATDPIDFVRLVVGHMGAGVGAWLTGGIERAGIPPIHRLDLLTLLGYGEGVAEQSAGHLTGKLRRLIGDQLVDAGLQGVGAVGSVVRAGPAAAWQEIAADQRSNMARKVIQALIRMLGGPGGGVSTDQGVKQDVKQDVEQKAQRADRLSRQLTEELGRSVAIILSKGGASLPQRPFPPHPRALSRRPEAAEFRRHGSVLMAAAGGSPLPPAAGQSLSRALSIAASATAQHVDLLLWLEAVRRHAARTRLRRRR